VLLKKLFNFNFCMLIYSEAGVALSVWCLTTDWKTGVRSQAEAKDFSYSVCDQTSCKAHPASYSRDSVGPFSGVQRDPGRDANHSPHLVPKSRVSKSYISFPPWCLHGMYGKALHFTFYVTLLHFSLEKIFKSSFKFSLHSWLTVL
jgi:hypothetical protein